MGLTDWMTQEQAAPSGQPLPPPPPDPSSDALAMGNVNGHGPLVIGQPPAGAGPPPVDPRSQATADMFSQQLNDRIGIPQTVAPAPIAPNPAGPVANDNGQPMSMPMVQPPHVVPGAWDKGRLPFQKGTIEKEEQGILKHEEAAQKLTEAVQQQGAAVSQFYDQQAELQQAQLAARQKAELDRDAKYNEASKRYQTLMDDAGTQTVDTNRWLGSQSTGSRVLMAIGAALGGFAQGMGKGSNPMLETIQRNIDRDIDAQKNDIATKKWKAGSELNMLGELRSQGMDQRMAENVVANAQWRIAEDHLKGLMAKTDNPAQAARGQEMLAQINDKRTELSREADMYMHTNPHVVGGGGPAPGLSKDDQKNVFMGVDGQRYVARNTESRKKLADAATTYQEFTKAVDDYKSTLGHVGTGDKLLERATPWTTGDMSKAQTAYNHVLSIMRKAQDDGVWKKSEAEMLTQTLTPPQHFTGDAAGQLDIAKGQAKQALSGTMRSEDPLPVETGFGTNARGERVPVAEYTGQQNVPKAVGMPAGAVKIGQ